METAKSGSAQGMEDNLKKAVTEMLILTLLDREDMYSAQITQTLEERSGGSLNIVFPYAALYRLMDSGYILEAYKKIAPDGRRRQYFQITDKGRDHLAELSACFGRFMAGVDLVLDGKGGRTHGE